MSAELHILGQTRLIDTNGIADDASIYFFLTGTLTPASTYTTEAMNVAHPHPIPVASGAAVPDIYLNSAVTYRRRIVYSDGSVDDTDPYLGLAANGISYTGLDGDTTTAQARLAERKSVVSDFGADPTGAVSAITAFNAAVAYANANGSFDPLQNLIFTFDVPDGVFDLTAGNLTPILVANVTFNLSEHAVLRVRDNHLFTLGSVTFECENFTLRGGATVTTTAETPNADQALVWIENAARVKIANIKPTKLARLLACDLAAATVAANIYVEAVDGTGLIGRNFIDMVNTHGGAGADLLVFNCNTYPRNLTGLGIPANPTVVPLVITAATAANPVAVTTNAAHGLTTGATVHIRNVGGMTQINDLDFTVTVTGATTFTLGVNGSGYGAYTTGGFATQRHWSYAYSNAFINIQGQWDTVVCEGGVHTNWPYLWHVTAPAAGSLSFVEQRGGYVDLIGKSMIKFTTGGGLFSQIAMRPTWLFTFEGSAIELDVVGAGVIYDFSFVDTDIGMLGGNIVADTTGKLAGAVIDNIRINGSRRATGGLPILIDFQAGSNAPLIRDILVRNPVELYGAGTDASLLPYYGISLNNGSSLGAVQNCYVNAISVYYNIPIGAGDKLLTGNRCASGGLPEYIDDIAITVGASPYAWVNRTGVPCYVKTAGGTVSASALSMATGSVTLASATDSLILVGRSQTLTTTYSGLPTMTAIPVNT